MDGGATDGEGVPRSPVPRPAPLDHPVLDVIANRWSSRAIDPDRPVDRAVLLRLLEAARWTPSSGNAQPWRFLVFDDTVPEARDRARDCLTPGNAWARRAPVLLAALTLTTWPGSDDVNPTARYSTGAASMALSFQGVHEGLVVHQMAGFDRGAVHTIFGLPGDVEPQAMIAIGWPGNLDELDERTRQRETKPRARRPIEDFTMVGHWTAAGVIA